MCGRFTQKTPPAELAEAFDLALPPMDLGERYNIAPSLQVLVVPNEDGPRRAVPMRWGLVPHWARDPAIGNQLANARGDTLDQRPSFREALRRRRGLLLMDGFYEWHSDGRRKVPFYFTLPGGEPFAVAALWESWSPSSPETSGAEHLLTTCLITTDPHPTVAAVHDRMPVILPRSAWPRWLDPRVQAANDLQSLLIPWQGDLQARQVSRWVNDASHEGPTCVTAAAPDERVQLGAAPRQGQLF